MTCHAWNIRCVESVGLVRTVPEVSERSVEEELWQPSVYASHSVAFARG